jgi:hypothetical protein
MSENPDEAPSEHLIQPPPDPAVTIRVRAFLHRHYNSITAHPGCAFAFAAALACVLGVWLSNGDLFAVIPVLTIGFFFSALGWCYAPNLSLRAKTIWIVVSALVIAGEGYIVYRHFHPAKMAQAELTCSTPKEPNTDASASGFFAAAIVRLYDTPELRRKYIFDALSPTCAHISFYVSPSDVFVFSVTDINKEPFSLEVPIASDDIPLNRYIFLYCEVALQENSTVLRIIVDGKQIASRTFGVRVELGKDYWKWTRSTFGADTNGQNNAPFKVAIYGFGHGPMTDQQVLLMRYRFKAALPGISLP